MKILVYGCGVIGSYPAHVLCAVRVRKRTRRPFAV